MINLDHYVVGKYLTKKKKINVCPNCEWDPYEEDGLFEFGVKFYTVEINGEKKQYPFISGNRNTWDSFEIHDFSTDWSETHACPRCKIEFIVHDSTN